VIGFILVTANFWVEKEEGIEHVFVDLGSRCTEKGCGGRYHCVVHVGTINDGRYQVRNASAMEGDHKFALPKEVRCSNCGTVTPVDDQSKTNLSIAAQAFVQQLKNARQQANALLN